MQRFRQGVFDASREDELVQALMEPCPEIFTSSEAVNAAEDFSESEGTDDPDGVDAP